MAFLWLVFYRLLTFFLLGTLLLCLPILRSFKPKLAKWFSMRFWPEPLSFRPKLWFHAVSVGETNIALALLERLPNTQGVLLTTTTQSGYKVLCDKLGRESVRYLPWDLASCYARLFGDGPVPHLVVVETEIWPVLFSFVRKAGAQLVIVNGRLSSKTLRWRRNPLLRRTLGFSTRVLARDDKDLNKFLAFGLSPKDVITTGNIKFDFKPKTLRPGAFEDWVKGSDPLLIFASISSDEADLLAPVVMELVKKRPDIRILWAPRHLRELDPHLQALAPLRPKRRSEYEGDEARFMILDSFGELSGCYPHAELSVTGGTFNQRGGQNFLESLQAGTPALLGPSFENFREEANEAIDRGAVLRVNEPGELTGVLEELLSNKSQLSQMSEKAHDFLAAHTGAVERTMAELLNLGVILEPSGRNNESS